MNCFIHNKVEFSAFCVQCKRPICNKCFSVENGICPRCSSFTHKTIVDYNKKTLKYFIPYYIIKLMLFWNLFAIIFFSNEDIFDYLFIILLLICSFLPFIINIVKYGFSKALKYQIFGKRNSNDIVNENVWKTIQTWFVGIISLIVCSVLMLVIMPLFILTDFCHLFFLIKDYVYHRKRLLSETDIINL